MDAIKFNKFQDYNERNFGLAKLRARYPKLPESEIIVKLLGRKPRGKKND